MAVDLPPTWRLMALGDLDSGPRRTVDPSQHPEEVFEYYSIPAYQQNQAPVATKGAEIASAKLILEPRAVLFGKLNPRVEKVWRVNAASKLRQIGSTEWLPLVPNGVVTPDFLYFLCRSDWVMNAAKGQVSGSTPSRQRVDPMAFYRIPVPIPPLDEQRQMVAVLSAVQRAIERQERLIALTAELKYALMQKLFVDGTRGEPLRQTEIGRVPESWKLAALGSVAKIGNGSTPKRDKTAYWKGGSIPWLTSGKIHESRIKKPDQYVTETAKAECHLPLVSAGSLLVAITGEGRTLGNTALVEFDTCVSQHLAYVQFHDADVVPAFLLYFLQRKYTHLRQMSVGVGSTKKALTCGLLKRYVVALPTKNEQREVAAALDTVVAKKNVHERTAESLRVLFRSLLQRLITAQVRVHDLDLSTLEETAQEPMGVA
jgi:type I restriction enzyme, S subunit